LKTRNNKVMQDSYKKDVIYYEGLEAPIKLGKLEQKLKKY